MYLAMGPQNEHKTHEEQMDELREYFKKKIVNAYNSLYLENNGMLFSHHFSQKTQMCL